MKTGCGDPGQGNTDKAGPSLTLLLELQVATALIKLDAPRSLAMAVVPLGTANDFATSLGLPEDPWEALQLCVLDTAHHIDVGQVNDKVQNPCLSTFHLCTCCSVKLFMLLVPDTLHMVLCKIMIWNTLM